MTDSKEQVKIDPEFEDKIRRVADEVTRQIFTELGLLENKKGNTDDI